MAAPLAPDTPPDAALRRIAADCHADLEKYRTIVLASRRPVGIHQTRVALRRLRAAFSIFRGAVVGPTEARLVRGLSAEAKWLAGECAPARDLHVFLNETVSDMPPVVRRAASRVAKAHLERARTALTGARYNAFNSQLAAFASATEASSPSRLDDFGRAVLDQRHGKVERRGRRIGGLDGKRLHRLRIAIKKLRYAATFLQPAFASRAAKAYIEATVRLQGALGALNDREVAGQMVADIAVAARPAEDVAKPLRQLAKQAASGDKRRRKRLQRAWKTFKGAEPFWRR
jgi:CHAD domain-containing protein